MRPFERLIVGIELLVLAGMVVHAPLTVWLGTLLPQFAVALKFWKEALLFVAIGLVITAAYRRHKLKLLLSDRIIQVILAYLALHLVLIPVQYTGFLPTIAGLMIDLRYVAFFAIVWATVTLFPLTRSLFVKVAAGGALVVTSFALLQVTVLPPDILKYIGYSKSTIMPYLTVDLNHAFIRINSTLRGPNPLGAYAGATLTIVAAYLMTRRNALRERQEIILGIIAAGALVGVWVSYSRSAVVAAVIMIAIVVFMTIKKKLYMWWIGGVTAVLIGAGALFATYNSSFVSNVVLHENPAGGSAQKSNEGHIESLEDGSMRVASQPLGSGIGSTGSASLYGRSGLIVENQYLFVAHEVGWIGLALFVWIFVLVMTRLWKRRQDWLATGVFASGVGLAFIGILLPVWADDTVSLVWWALAAVAVATEPVVKNVAKKIEGNRNGKKRAQHKKTA